MNSSSQPPMPPPAAPVVSAPSASPVVIIAALAVACGLVVVAFVVYRLRKLDPVSFRRAVANGGVFHAGMLIVHLADAALDIGTAVSIGDNSATDTSVVALFSVLTAIATVVSIVEIVVDVRVIRRLVKGRLDIDEAAKLNRHVSYIECLTLFCEDVPMLIVTAALEYSNSSAVTDDASGSTLLLAVLVLSAVMLGMKLTNLRPLLEALLAKRTYEDEEDSDPLCEMTDVDEEDLETLITTMDEFAVIERHEAAMVCWTARRRREAAQMAKANGLGSQSLSQDFVTDHWRRDEAAAASASRDFIWISGGGGPDAAEASMMGAAPEVGPDGLVDAAFVCFSNAVSTDAALPVRVRAALKDLRSRPLDMNSQQQRLDAMAVILELAYPQRYAHLQRSAEATAQALTQSSVSQNEFYAVVLPYLMLLYDKAEMEAVKVAAAAAAKAEKSSAKLNTATMATSEVNVASWPAPNAISGGGHGTSPRVSITGPAEATMLPTEGAAQSGRVVMDEVSSIASSNASSNSSSGGGHAKPLKRTGFSMVRIVRMRDEQLERMATAPRLRPVSRPGTVNVMARSTGLADHAAIALSPVAPARSRRAFSVVSDGGGGGGSGLTARTSSGGRSRPPQSPLVAFSPNNPSTQKLVGHSRRQIETQMVSFQIHEAEEGQQRSHRSMANMHRPRPPPIENPLEAPSLQTPNVPSGAPLQTSAATSEIVQIDAEIDDAGHGDVVVPTMVVSCNAEGFFSDGSSSSDHDLGRSPTAAPNSVDESPSNLPLTARQSAADMRMQRVQQFSAARARFVHAARKLLRPPRR